MCVSEIGQQLACQHVFRHWYFVILKETGFNIYKHNSVGHYGEVQQKNVSMAGQQ